MQSEQVSFSLSRWVFNLNRWVFSLNRWIFSQNRWVSVWTCDIHGRTPVDSPLFTWVSHSLCSRCFPVCLCFCSRVCLCVCLLVWLSLPWTPRSRLSSSNTPACNQPITYAMPPVIYGAHWWHSKSCSVSPKCCFGSSSTPAPISSVALQFCFSFTITHTDIQNNTQLVNSNMMSLVCHFKALPFKIPHLWTYVLWHFTCILIGLHRIEGCECQGGRGLIFSKEQERAIGNMANNAIGLREIQIQTSSVTTQFSIMPIRSLYQHWGKSLKKHHIQMKKLCRVPFERRSERVKDLQHEYVKVSNVHCTAHRHR